MTEHEGELHFYGDPGIVSADAKVPSWLLFVYISLPIWGIISLFLFWNGTFGWFDRGYWFELEKAANTTFPNKNYNEVINQKKPES